MWIRPKQWIPSTASGDAVSASEEGGGKQPFGKSYAINWRVPRSTSSRRLAPILNVSDCYGLCFFRGLLDNGSFFVVQIDGRNTTERSIVDILQPTSSNTTSPLRGALLMGSQCVAARFPGSNANHVLKCRDKYLAVTDIPGTRRFCDRLDCRLQFVVIDCNF
jgi:hypothetical protein